MPAEPKFPSWFDARSLFEVPVSISGRCAGRWPYTRLRRDTLGKIRIFASNIARCPSATEVCRSTCWLVSSGLLQTLPVVRMKLATIHLRSIERPLLQRHCQPTRCLRGGEINPVLVLDVSALLANIVEDRGKLGVTGSPDHVVVLALEVVTVRLYFSSPQIPLLNGPGLAPPAALRGRPKGNREVQVNNFMTRDSKRQAGATKGCEFYGSGYEPGPGDVDERCASLEGLERQPQTCSRTIFGGNYVDEIMRYL